MTNVNATLIQKDSPQNEMPPNNYRPINCFLILWKIQTAQIREEIYNLLKSRGLFSKEQKGWHILNKRNQKSTIHWSTHPQGEQSEIKIKGKNPNYIHIFTDGSKPNNAITRAAIINRKIQIKKHLPKETSIFSAEVYAINLALDLITKSRNTKHLVFSDTQSTIVVTQGSTDQQ